MHLPGDRIAHLKGSPYHVGVSLGRRLGSRLGEKISRYIKEGPERFASVDETRLRSEAMPWLERMPERFREEMIGLAEGAGLPVQRVAEWSYVEGCTRTGCSSILFTVDGRTWVGRNNDLWAPELWGYVIVREVDHRIPTMAFGMEAETFTATGINRDRLWLHYHYLPPLPCDDDLDPEKAWFEFAWMTEALEICSSLRDVEAWLSEQPRRGSMLLFCVEGKTGDRAIFECSARAHRRWDDCGVAIAGTNHRRGCVSPHALSVRRLEAMQRRMRASNLAGSEPQQGLISVLADPDVEQSRAGYGTVYANLACPQTGEIRFAWGGFPAASQGTWSRIPWPWPSDGEAA